ncbi:hypothetical protein BC938DRAFT_478899 [Jimgerdemannia flammicorona]|uniref:Phosphatase phospho-type n=1 Tax=Jimgerdemannia flammicorona TaxID=994334 RepID=A0A433QM50_9FUNG|nr:hypothetical protein BC938DRAFT_478899 [Jimgerdemannia flammicorona]
MLEAIKLMKDSNMELIILSDSNTVYIGIILKAYGVSDLFTAAITNPGHFDDAGRLHIRRRVPPEEPHGCTMGCALNICKGQELSQYLSTRPPFNQIIYVGDGTNDFCPATRLSSTDLLLPRLDKALANTLRTNPAMAREVKAEILYWRDGDTVLEIVRERVLQQAVIEKGR